MPNKINRDDSAYKSAEILLLLYISFAVMSYWWVLSTGTYNGDYIWIKPKLSQPQLFFNFIMTVVPFLLLFAIYRHYKKLPCKRKIAISTRTLGIFVSFLIFFNLITTSLFGVGKVGQEIYTAPLMVKLCIQILNRFDSFFGVAIYMSVSGKKSKWSIFLLLLIVVLSLLRFSLGIFLYCGEFLIIFYYSSIRKFIKKYFVMIVVLVCIFPALVSNLYVYRNALRDGESPKISFSNTDMNAPAILIGRLIGRLSSYSNSAIILERKTSMINYMQDFSVFQYPKESLNAFYGGFLDRSKPNYLNIMKGEVGAQYNFMPGTQGIMFLSLYQNFLVFVINMLTLFLIVNMAYKIISLLHYPNLKELLFMYFCYCVLSGVNYEYMSSLVCVCMYTGLFLVFNFLKIGGSIKNG